MSMFGVVFFGEQDRRNLSRALAGVTALQTGQQATQQSLANLTKLMEAVMSEQSRIDTDVAGLEASIAALTTAAASFQAALDAAKAANPTVDLSGLDQAVTDLGTATSAVQAAVPPAAPPAAVPPA